MDNYEKSTWGMVIFLILVAFVGVAGYFVVIKNHDKKNSDTVLTDLKKDYSAIKLDQNQDYVYQTDFDIIIQDLPIVYSKININVNSTDAKNIENALNGESANYKNDISYISDVDISEEDLLYDYENIYRAPVRNIETYNYEKYLTIIISDYIYYCTGENTTPNIRSFVFDLESGNLLSMDDLLKVYSVSETDLISKIKASALAEYNNNSEMIMLDETNSGIDNLNQVIVFINDKGKLMANYLVITQENNYNENVEIG